MLCNALGDEVGLPLKVRIGKRGLAGASAWLDCT